MQVVTYPGRGTDDGEDFEDWSMHALRERVKLVQELDQLADRMVELVLRLTREAQVIEEEYFLPQTARCWSQPHNRKEQIYAECWR